MNTEKLIKSVNSSKAEIESARGNKANLKERLDLVDSSLEAKTNEIMPCSYFGFVADYVGTPQYDGNDGSRVTCTDNTLAFSKMLDECIKRKDLKVYFPMGHYGIKTGMISKDLTGCNLTILGDGKELSIIDFVKENNSNTTYVDEGRANYVAKISNANNIIFKNVNIKATTNYNNIGSQTDTNAVYYGAVWGFIFDKFNKLSCENVKVSNFNYRGFSTIATGTQDYNNSSNLVELINCEGCYNKGSGFWITMVKEFNVIGGDYHHNGQLGQSGTGYGVTASTNVGVMNINGGYYHHNYRKGFDTHGCVNVSVNNVVCRNNVIYHFAILNWGSIMSEGNIDINNVVLSNGYSKEDRDWLTQAYNALVPLNTTQKVGTIFTINDNLQSGSTSTCRVKNITLSNIKVLSNYNGSDVFSAINAFNIDINTSLATLNIINCDFNLKCSSKIPTNVYNSSIFQILCNELIVNGLKVYNIPNMKYGDTDLKRGALFLTNRPSKIDFSNVEIQNLSGYIFGGGQSGEIINSSIDNNTKRRFKNCLFDFDVYPPIATTHPNLFGTIVTTSDIEFNNTRLNTTSNKYLLPSIPTTQFEKPFTVTINAVGATTNFCEIILEKVAYITLEIYLNIWGTLVIKNDTLALTGLTEVVTNAKYQVASMSDFTDTDGVTRTKIILATKNNTSGASTFYGNIKGYGNYYSWGFNKMVGY